MMPFQTSDDERTAAGPTAQPAAFAVGWPSDLSVTSSENASLHSGALTRFDWMMIAGGIAVAGGFYPIVLGAIALFYGFLRVILTGDFPDPREQFVGIAFAAVLWGVVAGMIGMLWSMLVTLFSLPVVYLFVWSLKIRGSVLWFGAAWGGLVGFLAVLPFVFSWFGTQRWQFDGWGWEATLMLAAGPGLATILGQLGGAGGARRAARLDRLTKNWRAARAALEATIAGKTGDGSAAEAKSDTSESSETRRSYEIPARFQFRIGHLLWITVWLSLLLAAIRLSGVPYELILPLLVGWLVFQSLTLFIGWRLVRWRGQRTGERGRIAGQLPPSN